MEGNIVADVNLDSEGNMRNRLNYFYIVGDQFFIKPTKEDLWYTHCIPRVAMNPLKDINGELLYFEISSIYVNIQCYASNEKDFLAWTGFLGKWIEEKPVVPKIEDSLDEFYRERKNVNQFVMDITSLIVSSSAKWKIPKAQLVEAFVKEFGKLDDAMDVYLDKSYQGKKQILMSEKEVEKLKIKADRVDKLDQDNFELFKRLNKAQTQIEIRSSIDDELEQSKGTVNKMIAAIRLRDQRITELSISEGKIKKELAATESRIEETKKIEDQIRRDKLDFLSISTKNQQLELCVKLLESTIKEKESLIKVMKEELKDIKKFQDRDKRLSLLVQQYEAKLGLPRTDMEALEELGNSSKGGSKTPRSSFGSTLTKTGSVGSGIDKTTLKEPPTSPIAPKTEKKGSSILNLFRKDQK